MKTKTRQHLLHGALAALGFLALAAASARQEKPDTVKEKPAPSAKWLAKAKAEYPVDVCLISDEKLDAADTAVYVHKEKGKPDRLVRFCCDSCIEEFQKEPARYLKMLDDAAKAQKKPAPKG